MKKNNLQRLLLTFTICLIGTIYAWADYYRENGIVYLLDEANSTASVCDTYGYITTADIKSNVCGCAVTSIKGNAFKWCTSSLKSVTIPSSVKRIERYAFFDCHSLQSVILYSTEIDIDYQAFEFCYALTSLTLSNNLTEIKNGTFAELYNLKSVTIPNSVTSIGRGAFSHGSIRSFIVPESVKNMQQNNIYPNLLQGTFDVISNINPSALYSLRLIGQDSNQRFETPQLSYIDIKCPLSSLSCFTGTNHLAVHLNEGINYSSELLKGSEVEIINVPADMHEWKFDMPKDQMIIYVETDSLYLTTPFRESDYIICTHPGGTKVVTNFDLLDYGGTWYGDFKGYIKEDNTLTENPMFETNENAGGLLNLYDLLCIEPTAIDLLLALDNTEDNRQLVYEALQSNLYPFHTLRLKSTDELQEKYKNINDALKTFVQTCYDQLQALCDTYKEVKAENVYPYINADTKNTFESALAEATTALAGQDVYKVNAARQPLQTAYDSIIVVIKRYNETLQTNKATLQQYYETSCEVGKTTYTDVYPYIDAEAKSAYASSLAEAQEVLLTEYDNEKIITATVKLQTAYYSIGAVISSYNEALQTCKQQLNDLCTKCNKVGKSTDVDVYPYIDATVKDTFASALTNALSDTIKQTYNKQDVQTAQVQLQAAYDKVMELITTYNETLKNAKQALRQQIQTEGDLKSQPEYTQVSISLRNDYENALASAKSIVERSYDVTAIANAKDLLHQSYEAVNNVIKGNLDSAREVLRNQLSRCSDYESNDDAKYFCVDNLRKMTSRAEAALRGSDTNSMSYYASALSEALSAIDAEITANKAKEQEVRQLFEDCEVVLDDLSQYAYKIDRQQWAYITKFNLYDEYPQLKEISLGDSVYSNSDQTFYRYQSNISNVRGAMDEMHYKLDSYNSYDNNSLKFYDNRNETARASLCTYDYAEMLSKFITWGRNSIDEINATANNDSVWVADLRDRLDAMIADEYFSYLSDQTQQRLSYFRKQCGREWTYASLVDIILDFYNGKYNETYAEAAMYIEKLNTNLKPLKILIDKARLLQADKYAELYATVDEADRNSLSEAITQAQACADALDFDNMPTSQATLQQIYYTIYGTMYVALNQQCNEWVAKASQLKVDYADVYNLLSSDDTLKLSNAVDDVKKAENLETLHQAMLQLIAVYNEISAKLEALQTTTAIVNVDAVDDKSRIYDLHGHHIVVKNKRELKSGVYIINGRKVIIK